MTKKIKVYVAGPYTGGDVVVNVRSAIAACDKLLELGLAPFCPHLFHFWHLLFPHSYQEWLDLDNQFVICCDALLRIPGRSDGADQEVELARRNNIPVFYTIEQLLTWAKKRK